MGAYDRYELKLFTFQYASIKPFIKLCAFVWLGKFTFQYASIKPEF